MRCCEMIIETDLLKEYKEYMSEKSTFANVLKIVPTTPQNFTVFPVIIFRERNNTSVVSATSLNRMEYADELFYQVDIYSKDVIIDKKKYPARDVITELRVLTADFFRQVGFTRTGDTPNDTLSTEVKRRTMTFEAQLASWNKYLIN